MLDVEEDLCRGDLDLSSGVSCVCLLEGGEAERAGDEESCLCRLFGLGLDLRCLRDCLGGVVDDCLRRRSEGGD